MKSILIVLLVISLSWGSNVRRKRFFDHFKPPPFPPPFNEDYPPLAERLWRLNKNIEDRINRNWNFQTPDYFDNEFEQKQNEWEQFEPRINFPDWFSRRPFESWPSLPGPDSWEVIDVTGIRKPFFSVQPWWKGPNVCVQSQETVNSQTEVEQEDTVSNNETNVNYEKITDCKETETSYVCEISVSNNNINKTKFMKYECCHGFKRRYDGKPGCIEVDLKDLVQTMRKLVLSRFLEIAVDIDKESLLRNNNYTVFSPTNEAFEAYEKQISENDVTITTTQDTNEFLMSHVIEGFYKSGDFIDEQVLKSANENSGVRTNIYYMPEKIVTANCVRIIGINNYARNGIVHILNGVLSQPTKSIADIISSDPQFSILKGLLSQAGLVQTLRDPSGNFTLFAAPDSVFSNESKGRILEKLMDGGNCVTRTLKNHLLPNVICTSVLASPARTVNVLEKYLTLSRKENNKLYVDGVQIVAKDIMATNGVVHIIDGLLLPEEATTITEALEEADMTELLNLIKAADLQSELDALDNFTFFVPSIKALRRMSSIFKKELMNDKQKLRDTLLYHVLPLHRDECDFRDNMQLETSLQNKTIRINQNGVFPEIPLHVTAQCTRVIVSDRQICGGVIHLVDQLLIPPKNNIMEIIEDLKEFSILKRLLEGTGLDRELRESEGPFTLFAPTDTAFEGFSEIPITELTKDWPKAEQFLKTHILKGMKCCASIHHLGHQARTLEGSVVPLHRSITGWIWYGRARIHQCDLTAENGVVHIVDKVLPMRKRNLFDLTLPDPLFGVVL